MQDKPVALVTGRFCRSPPPRGQAVMSRRVQRKNPSAHILVTFYTRSTADGARSKDVVTRRSVALSICAYALSGCGAGSSRSKPGAPVIAFLDFAQDDTLATARQGFLDALDSRGYSVKKGTIEFAYTPE